MLADLTSLWLSNTMRLICSISSRTNSAPATIRLRTFLFPSRSFSTSANLDRSIDKVRAGADDAEDAPCDAPCDEGQWEQPGRGLDGPAGGVLEDVGAEVVGVGGPEWRRQGSG